MKPHAQETTVQVSDDLISGTLVIGHAVSCLGNESFRREGRVLQSGRTTGTVADMAL